MLTLQQLARYRFEGKSEQAVREEWIAPLLVHLGYGGDTLNEIRYELPVRLAQPFRRIGRQRVDVDYAPTVLGRGLWILEAKAAASEAREDAISQAWLYATHPEVDVPFMAVADGTRIAVYETTRANWDAPACDLATPELAQRFSELAAVLGAQHVAHAIRTRTLRHLGTAMRAEVSESRLAEYVQEVRGLADEARPFVRANYLSVVRDQSTRERQQEEDAVAAAGIFAVGAWANHVLGVQVRMMSMGEELLLAETSANREHAFNRFLAAALRGRPRVRREFWNFRLAKLWIALSCSEKDGCGFLAPIARAAVRDHLLDFPDDQEARAAHRLERVLPLFVAHVLRSASSTDFNALAQRIQEHLSDETRARLRLDGDRLHLGAVIRGSEAIWDEVPWTAESLNASAGQMEQAVARLGEALAEPRALAHDPYLRFNYTSDELLVATLNELGLLIGPEHLDGEIVDRLRELASTEGVDEGRVGGPARRLIAAYESRSA
jgi:hypothetical protein